MTDDELAAIEAAIAPECKQDVQGIFRMVYRHAALRLVAEVRRLRARPADGTEPDSLRVAADQAEEKGADVAAWWLRSIADTFDAAAETQTERPIRDWERRFLAPVGVEAIHLMGDLLQPDGRFHDRRLLRPGDSITIRGIPALAAEIDRLQRELDRIRVPTMTARYMNMRWIPHEDDLPGTEP